MPVQIEVALVSEGFRFGLYAGRDEFAITMRCVITGNGVFYQRRIFSRCSAELQRGVRQIAGGGPGRDRLPVVMEYFTRSPR